MRQLLSPISRILASTTIGVAVALSVAPGIAVAAAPQVQTQGPGVYRVMVGDFEVTALLDGTHPFPIDTVVEGMPKADIKKDLDEDFLQPPVQGSINAFLINTGSKLVLIDAGAGSLYGHCCGRLQQNLRAAGYKPEQVDLVLLTHLHKDHAGGIAADGKMAFPNATVRVSKQEADYWLGAGNKAKAPEFLSTFFDAAVSSVQPYQAAKQFVTFDGEGEMAPGIQAFRTPGHTPGHSSYAVTSRGKTLVVWGDIVHVASLQFRELGATVKYDSSATNAKASRHDLFEKVAKNRALVAAAHIPFPGLGHIRKKDGTFDWVPVNYEGDPTE